MEMDVDITPYPEAEVNKVFKFFECVYGPPKKLSDYAKHFKAEDEVFFEKTKKEQLSKALSKKTQWRPIPYRVNDLGEAVVLLSDVIHPSDPPTQIQITFLAMLEAFRDYMNVKTEEPGGEVSVQLTMDMIMYFCLFVIDRMNTIARKNIELQKKQQGTIASQEDTISSQQEEINRWEIACQSLLNKIHPSSPALTIKEAAAACGVNEKTIRRWEKFRKGEANGTPPPEWYPGRNVTVIELETLRKEADRQKRLAQANLKRLKKSRRYEEDRDRPADDDE